MIEAYWNLKGKPFDKAIKPQQLFISNNHAELMSRLDYIKNNRGLMLITGQPGVGKTTALRAFVSQLSELSFTTFYFPLSTVNVNDFYRQINDRLAAMKPTERLNCFSPFRLASEKRCPISRKSPSLSLMKPICSKTKTSPNCNCS